MTREEMLTEIDALRAKGHTVGITGNKRDGWRCEIDNVGGTGKTPMDAFEIAKKELGNGK